MKNFKIPVYPSTTNKTIRFPNELIYDVETLIKGKNSSFSAFVIKAVEVTVQEIKESEISDGTNHEI